MRGNRKLHRLDIRTDPGGFGRFRVDQNRLLQGPSQCDLGHKISVTPCNALKNLAVFDPSTRH